MGLKALYKNIQETCERISRKRSGLTVHLEKFVDIPAVVLPDKEPIIQVLKEACEEIYGQPISTRGTGPANESFMLIKMGIPTVVFGPIGSNAHAPNEFVSLESLTKTIQVYLQTIDKLANLP